MLPKATVTVAGVPLAAEVLTLTAGHDDEVIRQDGFREYAWSVPRTDITLDFKLPAWALACLGGRRVAVSVDLGDGFCLDANFVVLGVGPDREGAPVTARGRPAVVVADGLVEPRPCDDPLLAVWANALQALQRGRGGRRLPEFLLAIHDHPGDPFYVLIFADWLEDSGEPDGAALARRAADALVGV